MTVSKRLRFEILRRDNHTCRYCGCSAPTVSLTIDHVVPEALGGSDDPSNLVAACPDCNGGKSSSSPDAKVVADVAQDALRWSAAMRQAAEENRLHDNTDVYEAVVNAWSSYRRNQIPGDYRETIDQFLDAGLPAADIVQMAHVADAKPSIYNRWSYFCGCCWTRIRALQERASEIVGHGPQHRVEPTLEISTRWTRDDFDHLVTLADYPNLASGQLFECEDHLDGQCETDMLCQIVSAARTRESLEMFSVRKHRRERAAEAINDAADEAEDYVYG